MGDYKDMTVHIHPDFRNMWNRDRFKEQLIPAKRCPDFDEDCATVTDHAACHRGVCRKIKGDIYHTDPADGYCPYLNGMLPR